MTFTIHLGLAPMVARAVEDLAARNGVTPSDVLRAVCGESPSPDPCCVVPTCKYAPSYTLQRHLRDGFPRVRLVYVCGDHLRHELHAGAVLGLGEYVVRVIAHANAARGHAQEACKRKFAEITDYPMCIECGGPIGGASKSDTPRRLRHLSCVAHGQSPFAITCSFREPDGRECSAEAIDIAETFAGNSVECRCARHQHNVAPPPWPLVAPPSREGSPLRNFRRRDEIVVAGRWFAGVPFDAVRPDAAGAEIDTGPGKVARITAGEWIVTRHDGHREVWTDAAFKREFEVAS